MIKTPQELLKGIRQRMPSAGQAIDWLAGFAEGTGRANALSRSQVREISVLLLTLTDYLEAMPEERP